MARGKSRAPHGATGAGAIGGAPVTGRELYELYQQSMLESSGCQADGWDELEESMQAEWDHFATKVKPA